MMNWVRNHIGTVAGITVGVMVLWLIGTAVSLQSTRGETAGILFGKKVSLTEYQQALNAVARQALLNHGDKFREKVPPQEMERLAWQRLTLLEEAKRRKIQVTDQEVIQELQRWPLFQRNGFFDQGAYQAIVQYTLGTTPRTFEEEIRQTLMILKLTEWAIQAEVTQPELLEAFRQSEKAIQISFILFNDEPAAQAAAERLRQPGQTLEQIAQESNLQVIKTDFLKKSTPPKEFGTTNEGFLSLFDLAPGESGGPWTTPTGWFVARVEAARDPQPDELAAVEGRLKQELTDQKRIANYFSWYSELLKRANLQKLLPDSSAPETAPPETAPAGQQENQ
ncbi:MAG: peptidylprolyl isomerase [Candidatus Omnitrophica bacterium]|nr:peptidylprolyl isomerase [Candidatus Omnitrophota bacterium]